MNDNNTVFALGIIGALLQTVQQAMEQGRDVSPDELDAQWQRIRAKRAEFEARRQPAGDGGTHAA